VKSLQEMIRWRPAGDTAAAKTANSANASPTRSVPLSDSPSGLATLAALATADPQRSYWWRITERGASREVLIDGRPTIEEVRGWYPKAEIEPLSPEQVSGGRRSVHQTEGDLRAWLARIGETDTKIIEEIVANFHRDRNR
jgi:hypothetical protein